MGGRRVARIAVSAANYSIDKPYDYLLPEELADKARPGMRALVPFGRGNRRCEGIVLAVRQESAYGRLKPVDSLLDREPVLDEGQIKLALWMRERFFCTVYDALHAMLPAGIWFKLQYRYRIAEGVEREAAYVAAGKSEPSIKVLDALYSLDGGPVDHDKLKKDLGEQTVSKGLRRLMDARVVLQQIDERQQVGDKLSAFVRLTISAEDAAELAVRKRKTARTQAAVLQFLASVEEADSKEIAYFTGSTSRVLKTLEKAGLVTIEKREVFRKPEIGHKPGAAGSALSGEQREVYDGLLALYRSGQAEAALLHGVTGSGKTAVYLHLTQQVLADGKCAIILVPEIALTPQLMGNFTAQFGDRVAVLHSALGLGERYDEWKRIKSGQVSVVVGTRSAIFAPVQNLGLIVIDEEQEYTYKSESAPRYHARDVAKYRCAQSGALLLLGSATPAIESAYSAQEGRYHYFALRTRYNRQELPQVIIADMKENLKQGNATEISLELQRELRRNLETGQQSILFINRRGTSSLLACGECGYTHTCDRCSVSLTYHKANGRLMCHYCGASRPLDDTCPDCGGRMKYVGSGTQKIQAELETLFPGTPVLRMDTDTVTASQNHDVLLTRFEREKIPILVGTQMVTKGLDFPNVTLVGVVSADQALYVSDYRAQERTFSLITQVIGRAGRGAQAGRAVIQTFTPQHEVIQLASAQDYSGFYDREITMRRVMGVPPMRDLLSITCTGLDETTVLRCIAEVKSTLVRQLAAIAPQAEVIGPAPAGVPKVNNRYRYHVTIRCENNKMIRELVAHILRRVPELNAYRGVTVYGDTNGFM